MQKPDLSALSAGARADFAFFQMVLGKELSESEARAVARFGTGIPGFFTGFGLDEETDDDLGEQISEYFAGVCREIGLRPRLVGLVGLQVSENGVEVKIFDALVGGVGQLLYFIDERTREYEVFVSQALNHGALPFDLQELLALASEAKGGQLTFLGWLPEREGADQEFVRGIGEYGYELFSTKREEVKLVHKHVLTVLNGVGGTVFSSN